MMEALEDVTNKVVATVALPDDAMKDGRQRLVAPIFNLGIKAIRNAGGEHFMDNLLSITDLKVFV